MNRASCILFASLPVLALAACSRTPPPAADAAAPSASTSSSASASSDASAARASVDASAGDAGAISAKARANVVRDLADGRKKSRAKDWTGALAAFDRALAVAPDDARVLSEVGWAAFQANDLARAEAANKRALANERDPKLRAAILYNVGRVAEARGQKDAAKKAYGESLALRDNAEVKKRLAGLGTAAAAMDDVPVTCSQPVADVCVCLATHDDEISTFNNEKPKCKRAKPRPNLGDPRLFVVEWGTDEMGEKAHLLAVLERDRSRVLADLGHDYEPGAFGIHNGAKVEGGEARTVNGHTVVVVKSVQEDADSNMAGLELCEHHAKHETVCAMGDTPGSTKCTPPIPISVETGCGVGIQPSPSEMTPELEESLAEIRKRASKDHVKTAWSISDDGKVTVRVVEGSTDLVPRAVLRTHALF